MPHLRYVAVSNAGGMMSLDVVTQLHYLLTSGECASPEARFWDLTIGGTPIDTGDQKNRVVLLTSQRVSELAEALQNQSWNELERTAEASLDIMPGWHRGLRPEFEKLRDFMNQARQNGHAVLRVSSGDGFWYR
jgi:Domain of unknown function (DUF1877)